MTRKYRLAILLVVLMAPFLVSPTLAIKPRQFVVPTPTPRPKPTPKPKPTPTKPKPSPSRVKPATPLEKAPVLNFYFKVTVKGQGKSQPAGTQATTTWSVNRSYSGVARLDMRVATPIVPGLKPDMTPAQMQAALAKMKASRAQMITWTSAQQKPMQYRYVQVAIDDKMTTVSKGIGGESGEGDRTTTTTWTCDSAFKTYNHTSATLNQADKTFDLSLPFDPIDTNKSLLKTTTIKSTPSESDDGTTVTRDNVSDVRNPSIKGLLAVYSIGHEKPRSIGKLKDAGQIEFDSGDLTPDRELFSGIADSKSNVKVRVVYKATSW